MYDCKECQLGISPELEAALKTEAQNYVRRILGKLYDLIPESVREEMEREYMEKKISEAKTQVAGVGKQLGGVALGLGVLALLFLMK